MDATKHADVDSAIMEVLLSGLSSYYAAVATEIQALATMAVAVAIIAVYGLSFFFSSAAADAAAMVDASKLEQAKMATVYPSPLFTYIPFDYLVTNSYPFSIAYSSA